LSSLLIVNWVAAVAAVGRILAEKLGVPYYDKALIKPLEEKFDMTLDQIEKLNSLRRFFILRVVLS
jgi:hypothetical protein